MLRIIESTSAGQAQSYYSTADYYSEGQELVGRWQGVGAERLGLSGTIQPEDWEALCQNQHPETGETLTLRQKASRRVGYDFNFHVPKSVSLLYGLTGDERLLTAFRNSVLETMTDIEAEMQTRVRKEGHNEDRVTGNMVWGEFIHFTSRPVNGLPDPHLHAHCFVFNTTFDNQEQAWKAGQFGNLKRDASYFEAKFHVRLSARLQDLGLPVTRTKTGWELQGFGPQTLSRFSRRTQQIEATARKQGILDPLEKSALGAKTRERKQNQLSLSELRQVWTERLETDEQSAVERVANHIGSDAITSQLELIPEAISNAASHLFERKSVVPERTLLAESLKRSLGLGTVSDIEQQFASSGFLTRERQGRPMSTTPTVLAEERAMLQFARSGRGTCPALSQGSHTFRREWLNSGQRNAVKHLLRSHDRVMIVRGAAGVGKTSMMQEAVEAMQAHGHQVFTFAPTAKASRGVLQQQGFSEADTVARLLQDQELQRRIQGQVIWVDEAGLLGTRSMSELFALAEQLQARVILSGDRYQHGSVERGAALRLLETEAGLIPAEIKEIQRQRDRYKQAVEALSEGRITAGFQQLRELGWIREVPHEQRYQLLSAEYIDTVQHGQTALIVSPTHREAETITLALRAELRQQGLLGTDSHSITILRNANLTEGERADPVQYQPGDVLVFHQNAKGFRKGERITLDAQTPPVSQAARYQVFRSDQLEVAVGDVLRITQNGKSRDGKRLHNGDLVQVAGFDAEGNILTTHGHTLDREFGHFAYGYVVTSHASQGTDVDRVLIAQSAESFRASSKEQFYVSVSRGRQQALIFTDHQLDLLTAIQQTDERLSATELLDRHRDTALRQQTWQPEPPRSPTRESLLYDR